ncbi:hypothetical protein [Pacificibacter marinus]|uniref:hypothetical protein n=1 Tax=Pacificibacter marinus TaxID=658057 RepID=UPI001C066BC1|nr:hypothetical protein [Pacificibacter marinus]MBU2866427.1 hypothetical protein [Pacificibacter marinus]
MDDWVRIGAGDVSVALDASIGNIRTFSVAGRDILHTAHWVGTDAAHKAEAPVDAHLAGDFFCAPFGGSGIADIPPHGWTANSEWSPVLRAENEDMAVLKLALNRDVFGARVTKELRVISGHSVLYQAHVITGGQGALTFSHHPMLRLLAGGHIGFSSKKAAITPQTPLEMAHRFAYPARATDLSAFPSTDGGHIDLHRYPSESGHEDFVTLVEADDVQLGWTAVTRFAEDDIVLFIKDPRVMPVTMMWQSNGGRDYAPWSGRHTGVLGIEDGCCAGAATLDEAASDNPIAREGVATTLTLRPDLRTQVRHAIAVVPRPVGWAGVVKVSPSKAGLLLTSSDGAVLDVPFDLAFFDL